ncbi:HAMP domain-containing protein [Nonomuraea ferruginea]
MARSGWLPLRIKLMASMLALLGIGMSFIGVVSVSVLHGYLMDRVDGQVNLISVRVQKRLIIDAERREQGRQTSEKPLLIESDTIVLLRDPYGGLTPAQGDRDVDQKPKPQLEDSPGPGVYTAPAVSGPGEWRVRETATPYGTFVVATDLTEVNEITRRLVFIELLGGGGIVLILAVVGVTIVRRSMRPLVEIERTAGTIAAGELGRRVPDGDSRTEVGRLATALNGMLAQIESAFAARSASEEAARRSEDRMRQFVTDASHELRTPLTSIRGFAEYARQNPGADPAELMQRVENAA